MESLNDMYNKEPINSFGYATFEGFSIIINKPTGCFNATHLCNKKGKRFDNWWQLSSTRQLQMYYITKSTSSSPKRIYFVKNSNGQNDFYIYKEALLPLALWLGPEIYDKCYNIVLNNVNITDDTPQQQQQHQLINQPD